MRFWLKLAIKRVHPLMVIMIPKKNGTIASNPLAKTKTAAAAINSKIPETDCTL